MATSVRTKATSPAPAAVTAAEPVDATHELCVEADAGAEGEPASVHAAERDAPLALRPGEQPGALDGVARQPERAREHAGGAAREEADGDVLVDAVHDLVVRAVAAEDVDPLDAAPQGCGEVGGVPWPLREQRLHGQPSGLELPLDRHGQLGRHLRRPRIDDQGRIGHGATVVAPGT